MRAAALMGAGLAGLLDSLLLTRLVWVAILAWLATVAGIVLLWRAWQAWGEPRPTPRLLGGLLLGAGSFGVADSIAAHLVLGFHHVPRGGDALYFVGAAILLMIGLRVSTIPNRAKRRLRSWHV